MFLREFLMRFESIAADAQNLGVELFKLRDIPLKSLEFAGSDRGEISIIESQHHWTLLQGLREGDGTGRR